MKEIGLIKYLNTKQKTSNIRYAATLEITMSKEKAKTSKLYK